LTTFIIIGAIMVSIALALLLLPLFRARADDGRSALVVIALLAILLPLGAAGLYHKTSNYSWDPAAQQAGNGAHSIQEMIDKLQEKLKTKPEDVDGWMMLGRTEFVRNDYKKSAEAFGQAYKFSQGKNIEAIVGYAEAMAVADQTALRGKAAELFEEALRIDPANPKGLWYGGMAAAINGKLEVARERWLKLLGQELPADIKAMLAQRIKEVDVELGRKDDPELARLSAAIPAAGPAMGAMGATPASSASAAGEPAAAGGPGTVTVRVRIAPALAGKVPPGAPLFVLARDPTQPGPPFAAKRFAGASLPLSVVLTEQDAMMPARTIKTAKQLTIVARFSASGMPQQSSGDLYGEVAYDLASGKPVELLIDKQVP
jgi:cytochrome c-type biogenesis protein CcmH